MGGENLKKTLGMCLLTLILITGLVSAVSACDIDIKPWSNPNAINLGSNGVVPVAILTEGGFDACWVDPSTILFAGAKPVRTAMEDVDCDGDLDMICHFDKKDLQLSASSQSATLECWTFSNCDWGSFHFVASDPIKIAGK
jgi:hypothetical protein